MVGLHQVWAPILVVLVVGAGLFGLRIIIRPPKIAMKVKNSPIAIKYCENKGTSIAKFHEKFDKDLNILMDAIDRHGFVFWACPNGCNDFVDWNDDLTEATCRKCGRKSTTTEPTKW